MRDAHLLLGYLLVNLLLVPAWAGELAISPKISFEKTVCDLGQVGLATKNTCEFKFTNTGQARLDLSLREKNLGLNVGSCLRRNDKRIVGGGNVRGLCCRCALFQFPSADDCIG